MGTWKGFEVMFILGLAECLAHQNGLVNGSYDHHHHYRYNQYMTALGNRMFTQINQKGNSHPGGSKIGEGLWQPLEQPGVNSNLPVY